MHSFQNSSFDPQTLVLLETAFDEAWLTFKSVGHKTVKPDELARCVLRMAMEGERDPSRKRWRELIAWQCRARRYTRPLSDVKVANANIGVVEILL
jgi:hypothetical protein